MVDHYHLVTLVIELVVVLLFWKNIGISLLHIQESRLWHKVQEKLGWKFYIHKNISVLSIVLYVDEPRSKPDRNMGE